MDDALLKRICDGARANVKVRDLLRTLERAGCEVERTRSASHYKVTRGGTTVVIATKRGEVLPKYLSMIVNALGICDEVEP